ncbi:cytochrome b/b6 domain-containing protein [cf. Phormidesmis sp. LEGE 11477]|uniref:cytochrome b/b6 domain-containing protein n=1 Tax=cf. Phormidesmis sp. LEGE 11477 TaxID=1828680 RepID=UPI00188006A2|nr:cytochrome b/b6 domain-containing protein [cf. Phormidesmis sp. LEGE 11477]MBE9062121.1 cytochrome b/b6 domain-containing protein [cf. Phormidesmis sp. LEGE 11477]
MPRSSPYQPFIFRLIHAVHGILVLASIATGFWLYNTWDARFGQLPLPEAGSDWFKIHHNIGQVVTVVFAVFSLYSLFAGSQRLIQPKSIKQLSHVDKPSGQYALHRLINTGLLGMLILSLVSARQFGGARVLVEGEWNDVWYSLHLFAWASMVVLVLSHILLSFKIGGWPLVRSMVDSRIRPKDSPKQWPQRLTRWFQSLSR